jgi:hypothetical protein
MSKHNAPISLYIDDLDLSDSFEPFEETVVIESDLASGLDYKDLDEEDRREVKKQIRKFKTGY